MRDTPLRVTPIGNELALLGNIGALGHKKTSEFLRYCVDTFERTYWIPGPLEWNTRRAQTFGQKEELLNYCHPFRTVLPMIQTKVVTPRGLHILGTTLWSPGEKAHFYREDMEWLRLSLLHAPAAVVLTHNRVVDDEMRKNFTRVKWVAGEEMAGLRPAGGPQESRELA